MVISSQQEINWGMKYLFYYEKYPCEQTFSELLNICARFRIRYLFFKDKSIKFLLAEYRLDCLKFYIYIQYLS